MMANSKRSMKVISKFPNQFGKEHEFCIFVFDKGGLEKYLLVLAFSRGQSNPV